MSESAVTSELGSVREHTLPAARTGRWERWGKSVLMFVLIVLAYMLSFSFDENDSLDTAYWMEKGDIRSLLEYRHLVQRMLPLWLWQGLQAIHIDISALGLLNLWDFFSAAASVMLLYRVIVDVTGWRQLSFWASFAYGTAHCVWLYTGSGRLYSTSMFLVFAAFYLALQIGKVVTERARWVIAFASGTLICFAGLFWLVHVFSAISVGLLLILLPTSQSWRRRFGYLTLFSLTGIVLALVIAVSCLMYVQIPLEEQAIKTWMRAAGTQPMTFDHLSIMKATYGHAHGILVMFELPYLINGLMLKDPELSAVGSFPWQFSKFVFVWILLTLVYLYPLWLFGKSDRPMRILIAVLYIPLAINMFFGLGWLGSDVQRFMPSMLSQFVLAALSVQDLLRRVPKPRMLATALVACLIFIAADNLIESLIPFQRQNIVLAQDMKAIRPFVTPDDLLLNFGRDLSISYQTMVRFYGGARTVTTTNDVTKFNWDRLDWKENFENMLQKQESMNARLFVPDRLATGVYPVAAAWSNKQHSKPTVKQFAAHIRETYCLVPAFPIADTQYYRVERKSNSTCPAASLPPMLSSPEDRP